MTIASFFLIVVGLCVFKLQSVDFGWHLKAGEYIWTNKSIPTRDVFSYVAEGNKWVDSHWLFQLVLYGVHSIGGLLGLVFLRSTLAVATFGLLLSTIYRKEYLPISILVGLIALFTSYQRFVIRPELVSLLFLAAFFYFTERFSDRPRLYLVLMPLCQAVWANMHGLHVLGVVFLGLYLAGDAFQLLATRFLPWIPAPETTPRELGKKGVLFVLVLLALLANANGVDGILYPYTIFSELRGEVAVLRGIAELNPPFSSFAVGKVFPHPIVVYKLLLLPLSILAFLGQLRRIRFSHLLPYLTFLFLSTLAVRNMSLFAVVAAPITIRNLNGILDSLLAHREVTRATRRRVVAATAASMLVLTAGIWILARSNQLYTRMSWHRAFGVGELERLPAEMVAHLKTIEGNIFNSPELGGYLIWKLYPQKQVAADGRWEVYGDSLPMLLRAYRRPAAFSKLAKQHDISAIVLGRGWTWKAMRPWLEKSPEWVLRERTGYVLAFERIDR